MIKTTTKQFYCFVYFYSKKKQLHFLNFRQLRSFKQDNWKPREI